MKLVFRTVLLLMTVTLMIMAQEDKKESGWTYTMTGNLNLSQIALDNWAEGGDNAWSWHLNIKGKATREETTFKWVSSGNANFGKSKIGSDQSRKAVDEIQLESVYTRKLGLPVNPYAALTARTQFAKGYEYTDTSRMAISAFMDPGYFTQSVGMGYQFKDSFSTRLGAAMKETITSDFPVPYADDLETAEIETSRIEFGAKSVTDLNLSFSENLLFSSQLSLFSNFSALNKIDVDWDSQLTATINKYGNVNLAFRLLYDRDLHVKRQIKEALAIGLTYNFF
ncbi:MAG: DUF3078 domain-containing protein [Fidelibacterota bacterium]